MTTYKYKGQSLSGARVSGVVRAYDEFEAVAKLRDTCAFITKIEPVKERGNALDKPIGFRLKDKELALLCSQFSIILTSGLSVMRCVEMVASQTRNKYTRRMLEKVAEEVGAGYSLAQSFESNAPYLPATFIETVRAGEESGTVLLDRSLSELAVGVLQGFLDSYLADHPGEVDYIHDDDALIALAKQPNAIGFLLPAMEKSQLFRGVIADGILPRKTFSMGHSREKRYYLEGRKIK